MQRSRRHDVNDDDDDDDNHDNDNDDDDNDDNDDGDNDDDDDKKRVTSSDVVRFKLLLRRFPPKVASIRLHRTTRGLKTTKRAF